VAATTADATTLTTSTATTRTTTILARTVWSHPRTARAALYLYWVSVHVWMYTPFFVPSKEVASKSRRSPCLDSLELLAPSLGLNRRLGPFAHMVRRVHGTLAPTTALATTSGPAAKADHEHQQLNEGDEPNNNKNAPCRDSDRSQDSSKSTRAVCVLLSIRSQYQHQRRAGILPSETESSLTRCSEYLALPTPSLGLDRPYETRALC
jgi:hypothetical protein